MSIAIAQQPKRGALKEAWQNAVTSTDEMIAICPKCKTLETLFFIADRLVQTRKFSQEDALVYHDCGSSEPCRLLPRFLKKD